MDARLTLLQNLAKAHMQQWLSEPTPFPGTIEAATAHSYYRFENAICMEKSDRTRKGAKPRLSIVRNESELPYSDLNSSRAVGCMLVGFIKTDAKGNSTFTRTFSSGVSAVLLVSDASGRARSVSLTTAVAYFVEPEATVIPPPEESGLRLVRQPKTVTPAPGSMTRIHVAAG